MASEKSQSIEADPSANGGAAVATKPGEKASARPAISGTNPQKLPPFNVILLDDDDHSYQYVIDMLGGLFGHPKEKAYKLAKEVDTAGRVIVLTTTKEHAELKRDQIRGYGADPLMQSSHGSMRATIEPAID